MNKSIIVTARNEGKWAKSTVEGFLEAFPDVGEIIGVDDGGNNEWVGRDCHKFRLIKTSGSIGVARSRLLGVQQCKGDVVLITDGHVFYQDGDKDKAWELASEGKVVTSTTISHLTGADHGCGRIQNPDSHSAKNTRAKEGNQAGLIGGAYFMHAEVAEEIIAPSRSHGYNEQLMTYAALSLGHPIYCFPSFKFRHVYKSKFNYHVTHSDQMRNRRLIDWFFFGGATINNADELEYDYKKFVEKYRILDSVQLKKKIVEINNNVKI